MGGVYQFGWAFRSHFASSHFDALEAQLASNMGRPCVVQVEDSPPSVNLTQELAELFPGGVEAEPPIRGYHKAEAMMPGVRDVLSKPSAEEEEVATTAPSTPNSVASDSSVPSQKIEEALGAFAKGGGPFGLRGTTLGNFWSKELRSNPQLKREYGKQCGYEEQRKFRDAWAMKLWQLCKKSKTHEKFQANTRRFKAEFRPLAKWLDEQGGGEEAAEGLKYMFEKAKAEGNLSDFFEINEWTNMIEAALPRKSRVEESGDRYSINEEYQAPGSGSSSSVGPPPPPPRKKPKTAEDEAKPETKPPASPVKEEIKDPASAGGVMGWKELTRMKKAMESAISGAHAVVRRAGTDPRWLPLKSLPEYQDMHEALLAWWWWWW